MQESHSLAHRIALNAPRYSPSLGEQVFGIQHILDRIIIEAEQKDIPALARVNRAAFLTSFGLMRLCNTIAFTPKLLSDADREGLLQAQPPPFPIYPETLFPISRAQALRSIKHVKINATPLLHINCTALFRLKYYERPDLFVHLKVDSLTIDSAGVRYGDEECRCAFVFDPRVLIIRQSHDTALLCNGWAVEWIASGRRIHLLVDVSIVDCDIPFPAMVGSPEIYIHFTLWKRPVPPDRIIRSLLQAIRQHVLADFSIVGAESLHFAGCSCVSDADHVGTAVLQGLPGLSGRLGRRVFISREDFLGTEHAKPLEVARWYAPRKKAKLGGPIEL